MCFQAKIVEVEEKMSKNQSCLEFGGLYLVLWRWYKWQRCIGRWIYVCSVCRNWSVRCGVYSCGDIALRSLKKGQKNTSLESHEARFTSICCRMQPMIFGSVCQVIPNVKVSILFPAWRRNHFWATNNLKHSPDRAFHTEEGPTLGFWRPHSHPKL